MRPVIAFLLGLVLAPPLTGCDRQKAAQPQGEAPATNAASGARQYPTGRLDRSHAGTPAPEVTFEDPHGRPARIADFGGRPVLVNLWATWCAPCVAEMPTLDALAGRDPDLRVLALSQDLEGRNKVGAFFEQRKFSKLEPYLDSELSMMMALKVQTLPTTILYDAQGREVWRMTGVEDWTGPRAKALIAEARRS